MFLFSDLYLRAERIIEFYLGYTELEIVINSTEDVKRQVNKDLNLELSGQVQRNLIPMNICMDLKPNDLMETHNERM